MISSPINEKNKELINVYLTRVLRKILLHKVLYPDQIFMKNCGNKLVKYA